MLDILIRLKKIAPVNFELLAVNLNQMQPGFDETILPNFLEKTGIAYKIITEDTYSIVTDKIEAGKTMCSLCSRLRRGILYRAAAENGCTKIALGHHKDDILETFFLNIFFGGSLKTMPPKLRSDDGKHTVIRPLALNDESDLAKYAEMMEFPIIPCNLCGSQENLQRKHIKKMLAQWEADYPNRKNSIFKALTNVAPSHLLDLDLFDFETLSGGNTAAAGKDWLMPKNHEKAMAETTAPEATTLEKPLLFKPTVL